VYFVHLQCYGAELGFMLDHVTEISIIRIVILVPVYIFKGKGQNHLMLKVCYI